MPIITTYPFKKDPLANKDEIILSDSQSNDPNFKTKTTDLEVLMKYVKSKIQTIEPVSLDGDFKIQLTGLNGFGTAGQVIAVNQAETGLEYVDGGGGGSISVKDANTTVDPTKVLNFAGKIYTVTQDGTNADQANIAGAYNTSIQDSTPTATNVGSINAGTLASALKGNDLVDLLDKIFFPTLPPTYVQPTFSISDQVSGYKEVGATITNNTVTLQFINKDSGGFGGTMTLSRNTPSASLTPISITPTTLADLAPQFPNSDPNPNNPQIRQTGTYDDSFTISNAYTAAVNTITYTATANYTTGSQLQDSAGSLSGNPVQGGTKQATTSITAIYPYFWGISDTSQPGGISFILNGYANSISAVASAISAGTGLGYNKELALSNGTLTVPFSTTAGTTWMWFAYPTVNTTKTKWFESLTNKGDIGGTDFADPNRNLFSAPSQTSITTSLWGPIDYNIHIALKSAGTTTIELRNN
jgi:hypothetical protein